MQPLQQRWECPRGSSRKCQLPTKVLGECSVLMSSVLRIFCGNYLIKTCLYDFTLDTCLELSPNLIHLPRIKFLVLSDHLPIKTEGRNLATWVWGKGEDHVSSFHRTYVKCGWVGFLLFNTWFLFSCQVLFPLVNSFLKQLENTEILA